MEPDLDIEQSKHEIIATVSQPQNDVNGGYTTYLIMGNDQHGQFQIRRRFNDFFYLRQVLKKKWPGLYIPPIPQKQIIGNKDDQSIDIRKKMLSYFIVRLGKMKHLFYSNATQQFLRNKQVDMQKYFQTLGPCRAADLTVQFNKYFPKNQKINIAEIKNITINFLVFLKKAQKQLKTMRSQVLGIVDSRNGFTDNLNKCNKMMLPQYEKNIYVEYLQPKYKESGLVFVNDLKVQQKISNLKELTITQNNPFEVCLDLLTFELRQIQAMQQAISLRDQYEYDLRKLQQKVVEDQAELSKISNGKFTLKSIFSKGSKNQQAQILEKQIPQTKKQIQCMIKLCDIINYVLGAIQIPNFKEQKQIQYYEMIRKISNKQLQFLGNYGNFMKSIIQGLKKSGVS